MATLFETERLCVREIEALDFDDMMEVYGDLDAMEFVGDGSALPAEDCKRWIEITKGNYEKRGYGMSCVTLRETGETVGFCGLTHPGNQDDPELKYAYHRRFWRRGFATEAGRGMVAFGEAKHELKRIIATVDPDHGVSHAVLQKCGFAYEFTEEDDEGHTTATWTRTP